MSVNILVDFFFFALKTAIIKIFILQFPRLSKMTWSQKYNKRHLIFTVQ